MMGKDTGRAEAQEEEEEETGRKHCLAKLQIQGSISDLKPRDLRVFKQWPCGLPTVL